MTKEITKAFIIQQIQDKFTLRELIPETFSFGETVVPVYNIEQHLEEHIGVYEQISITSTGAKVCFTVPENEKWMFSRYTVVFMGGGAYTVTGVYIHRRTANPAFFMYLDMEAGRTASYHINLTQPVVLTGGDTIEVYVDGFTSTQDLRLYLDYMREILR